jgi:hypothetical protein
MRRHDWILDMLSDLKDYAAANGLPELACSVEMTLDVARREAACAPGPIGADPARDEPTH